MNVERISTERIDRRLARLLPYRLARSFVALPLYYVETALVVAAPNDKGSEQKLDRLGEMIKLPVVPYELEYLEEAEIADAIEQFYARARQRFGELLVDDGIVDAEQLKQALVAQKNGNGSRLGDIIASMGLADEHDLQRIYAVQCGYRYMRKIDPEDINFELIKSFPEKYLVERNVLPIPEDTSAARLYLLTTAELDEATIEEAQKCAEGADIEPVMVPKKLLEKLQEVVQQQFVKAQAGDKHLGQILIKRGMLTEKTLSGILKKKGARKLGAFLIQQNILPENAVMSAVAEHIGVPFMTHLPQEVPAEFTTMLTRKFAVYNKVVPIERDGDAIRVAMISPEDRNLLSILSRAFHSEIQPVLATQSEIVKAINRCFSKAKLSASGVNGPRSLDVHLDENTEVYVPDSIVAKVNDMLLDAVRKGASDIHISPEEDAVRIYFRIDGALCGLDTLPLEERDNLVTRIKILCKMRIDARHVAQGGRIVARYAGRRIDFRASILPTHYGENVVLRVLDSNKLLGSDFTKLGMSPEITSGFTAECERPQGIVLVTGPTGSGKTTTLYHVLNYLRKNYKHKSISTIENPIEYVVGGILQSEVNEARGLTYAGILKEKLRQDPDIMMVGEIRNLEEAKIAFDAALTGHMVLSTLHTNDGASTILRLVEIGLEPYNVSSGINCILSQRLARRVCTRCCTEVKLEEHEIERVRRTYPDFEPEEHTFKKGWGCDFCVEGFRGRVGIYEFLVIDGDIRALVSRNATDVEIRNAAVKKGMKTLRMAGLDLALQGLTTVSEVLAVTDQAR